MAFFSGISIQKRDSASEADGGELFKGAAFIAAGVLAACAFHHNTGTDNGFTASIDNLTSYGTVLQHFQYIIRVCKSSPRASCQ